MGFPIPGEVFAPSGENAVEAAGRRSEDAAAAAAAYQRAALHGFANE